MIRIQRDDLRFHYRVAAVVIRDARVLLHRAVWEHFWSLPGGRVEMQEVARDALCREMIEELGVEITPGRLLWVVENFFRFQRQRFHELALYFQVDLPTSAALAPGPEPLIRYDEQGTKLIFQWFELETLDRASLVPSFLRAALRSPPVITEHVVQEEEDLDHV